METADKKHLSSLFRYGQLKSVFVTEAPLEPGRWEMGFICADKKTVYAETRRGEAKQFATLEAAHNYAADIGFRRMEIRWS
ncbi:MAG TPA: hypothetical protein VL987_12175 [Cellvibrio sp.]|nr:hypothetical protein [Cellvibrio sp.]